MALKLLKIVTVVILFGACAYLFLFKFSYSTTSYSCAGVYTEKGKNVGSGSLYFKHENYRWWVDMWSESNSDGNIWLELPNDSVNYYPYLNDMGEIVQIFNAPNDFVGQYSTLSQTISIKTYKGVFDGKCKVI